MGLEPRRSHPLPFHGETIAAESIRMAQARYKGSYNKSSRATDHKLGDWVLVLFSQEETDKQ